MAVKIRCRRTGANNDPCFRIVATDSRSAREGKYLESLGWYDPKRKEKNFHLNLEKIEEWRKKGAQVSEIVTSLLHKAKKGLMAGPEVSVLAAAAPEPAQESTPEPAPEQTPEPEPEQKPEAGAQQS